MLLAARQFNSAPAGLPFGKHTLLSCSLRRIGSSMFFCSPPTKAAWLRRIFSLTAEAERGNHMAVVDSETLQRLRREESAAEQQGRQALNIAKILKDHPQHDAARQKADVLLARASALREQIVKIETI
jgi:hypothetical protein